MLRSAFALLVVLALDQQIRVRILSPVDALSCPSCDVIIDTNTTYQTWGGWCGNESYIRDQNFLPQATMDQVTDELTNDLGLTCIRMGFGRLNEWVNDDGDPLTEGTFVGQGSITRALDIFIARFCDNVAANSEPCTLSFDIEQDDLPSYLDGEPAEFGELFSRTFQIYRDAGYPVTLTTVQNEPGLNSPWATPAVLNGIIPTMYLRFQSDGVDTCFAIQEAVSAEANLAFIDVTFDQDVKDASCTYAWHRYSAPGTFGDDIVTAAIADGKQTAMMELTTLEVAAIFEDITRYRTSYEMKWVMTDKSATCVGSGDGHYMTTCFDGTTSKKYDSYYKYRAYMRYIRPGAVRVDVTSNDVDVDVVSFLKNGKVVTVLSNTGGSPSTLKVGPLASGSYGIAHTTGTTYTEEGIETPDGDHSITVTVTNGQILTIYPVTGNQAPQIKTWLATPTYITSPTTTLTTVAVTAEDTENDALTYAWAVTSQPVSGSAAFADAAAASTAVSGMDENGTYVFTVTVDDGTDTSTKTVTVVRYAADQPCGINPGSRFYREEGNVLPATTITLGGGFISSYDLEGASVTNTFSVVSQPGGASVSFTGTVGSGLTVAGDYVFRFTCQSTSGTTTAQTQDFPIKVYPEPAPRPLVWR